MSFESIPLDLSGRSVQLQVYAGDGIRFARLFMKAWAQVPPPYRQAILGYWNEERIPYLHLELSNCWKNCATRDAEVSVAGYEVKFNAREVERMPPEVVLALIAHELAHVFQHAEGINDRSYADLEWNAEDLSFDWGFDCIAKDEWRAKREMGLLDPSPEHTITQFRREKK